MEEEALIVLFRLVFAIIPGCMAIARNRNFLAYYMLGLLLSPLVSVIILVCIGAAKDSSTPVSSNSSTVNVYVSSEDDARRYVKTEVFHEEDNETCYSSTHAAFCYKCGAKLYEDSVFCTNCGTKVPDLAEEARRAEVARRAEEARKAEEARIAEEERNAEEARKAEQARRIVESKEKTPELGVFIFTIGIVVLICLAFAIAPFLR